MSAFRNRFEYRSEYIPNGYINRHAHTEYLKMIEVYSPLGILHVFLYSINRRMAENGFAPPPPLGNFADISYLVEN